jgi:hypothetical protein
MRATTKAGILSIMLLGAIAAVALAAAKAPVSTFKVVATVGDNDFGIDQGTKTRETFKFRCANEACDSVKLTRIDPGGRYKSTLSMKGKHYEGTEGPYPYPSCPDNNAATFTSALFVSFDDKNGPAQADAVKGTAETKIHDCDFASFVDYAIKGKLK